ncbi:hypothetical protein EPUS_00605 [Endocarpon pusillum Z07020]|uniref:Uncharacterized protein n=1 Tax=Endocarpon pusillum (strain Z07020 / HMAS-L-300199) TaxID=1263415 RepID=U1GIJ0_ENDPU|nr:uncharacterized protein EPUS_00605 [Endocarpon pusillum Z07020]ERF71616.1 hypothetical protein EPUS_00605 [Endocarpon pusillum Z07020]
MAGILDRCVPSRRLERRRQRALHENLDARFGDTHITAPTEGAWNQIGSDAGKEYQPRPVISGGWSPGMPSCEPPTVSRLSVENAIEDGSHDKESQRHNFTITIPFPWPSRKSHTRALSLANKAEINSSKNEEQGELSPRSLTSSPEPTPRSFISSPDPNTKSFVSSPNTTLPSQATSPVVIYKPVSEEYKQQLAEMAGGITRFASFSSPPPDRLQNTSPINVTYKPASEDFVKEMAEAGMGLSPMIPQRETFSHPHASSKSTQIGLPLDPRPTLVYSPEPRDATTGMPENPETTSRIRSPDLSLGLPAEPRVGTSRSASRGPTADRIGTTRSVSRGPAPDRAGTTRSSSRGPAFERKGSVHYSSRPSLDHHANRRSASRGPLHERTGNALQNRSASCVPTSTRTPYRESVSSDSSTGSGITPSSSPTLNDPSVINTTTNTKRLSKAERSHQGSVGSATGYYSAVAKEYRRIASDVEDMEYEKRRQQEIEDDRRRKRKEKAFQGPQEMVPDADELW